MGKVRDFCTWSGKLEKIWKVREFVNEWLWQSSVLLEGILSGKEVMVTASSLGATHKKTICTQGEWILCFQSILLRSDFQFSLAKWRVSVSNLRIWKMVWKFLKMSGNCQENVRNFKMVSEWGSWIYSLHCISFLHLHGNNGKSG